MPTSTPPNIWPQSSGDYALWVAAIGSILVVVVALFGDKIKGIFSQPRLEIKASTKAPFFEKSLEKATSNSDEATRYTFAKIKIEVNNLNLTPGLSCRVFIKEIHAMKPDGRTSHLIRQFQPTPLKWLGESEESNSRDIVWGIPSYIDFAQIRRQEAITSSTESSPAPDLKYRISLPVDDPENEGAKIKLKEGKYIMPLIIHANNVKPIIKFLYLYWNGNNPQTLGDEDFEINIMRDRDAKAILNQ